MTSRRVFFALAILLSFALVSCKDKTTPKKRKAPTKRRETTKPKKRVEKKVEKKKDDGEVDMKKEHFRLANKVLDAVIEGSLDKAKKAGEWLASADRLKEIPKEWAPHWKGVQDAGKALTEAKDQQAAALVVSKLAVACGSCHTAMKTKIKLKDVPLKDGPKGTKSYMLRHIWAAARFWEGLSTPDDKAWVKGAEALAKDKYLHKKLYAAKSKLQKEIRGWAKFVYKMGKKAAKLKKTKDRAKLMGTLMQGCFHCHQKMYVDLKQFPH